MEAANKKKLSQTAFVFVVSLVFVAASFYLYNIFKWGENYPDFGFGYRIASGVDVVGEVTDKGCSAGMRMGDRILKVNDNEFTNFREFRAAMNRELGEQNTYLLERDGQQLIVSIVNTPVGLVKTFEKSGLPLLLGLCYSLIGILVFLMKPHGGTSWIFFIFTSIAGLFFTFLHKYGVMRPFWLENLLIFTYAFMPAVFIHLALGFPEERAILRKHPYVQFCPYTASALLFCCIRYTTPAMMGISSVWMMIVVGYMTAGVLFFLGSCIRLRVVSRSEIVKLRSTMILLGFGISALVPLTDVVIILITHVSLVPNSIYYLPFFIVFPLSIGYSIVKHDLFDFDAIIKRTYGYVLTTGSIAGVYGLFVLISNVAFGRFEVTKSPMFPLVFILGVVFFFNPIRNRAQKFIDRVFYRLEYDYQDTVQKISETMRSLLNLDQIGKAMMDTALGSMFIDAGSVFLLNTKKNAYECLIMAGEREKRGEPTGSPAVEGKGSDLEPDAVLSKKVEPTVDEEIDCRLTGSKFPVDEPFIQKIAEKMKGVTVYDIQEDPIFEDQKESCKEAFEKLQATLIVPLIYEDRLTGLISLGEKKSGKFYRREDINLLNTLANQSAVAIENARMIKAVIEKERMEEELSIARDLQVSMLPAGCPTISGFEIAAYSVSAMEVGGDFYDFIEMGPDKVGMVIGDVTGKSVSGALVMSASRSVFRMLSEDNLGVGEIMVRANRRTKKDIKSGMFVALLYAVLNAEDRTLSMCSAGQTQPIHWSSKTSESSLVETKGDTFPLGILEDVDYQETRLHMAPGDKVVLYTDGIVEAMDGKEEMFGFDRLLEVVQGARSMTADSLLKEILDKVNAFAGGAAQHDDLTVIAISAVG